MPAFYRYLQCQDSSQQPELAKEFSAEIAKLVDGAHSSGPFFLGASISFVDVQVAPWFLRMRRVLKPYRGWPEPAEGSRLANWVDALEGNEAVKATTSGDELYLDSYERYAGTLFDIWGTNLRKTEQTFLPLLPSLSLSHRPPPTHCIESKSTKLP